MAASGCGDGVLIPSIDLKGGRIVQLVQGESLALESTDVDGWIDRFRGFDAVQLIDLDAAMALGNNDVLVRYIAARAAVPRRRRRALGRQRAHELIDAGATHVIVGSSLYRGRPRQRSAGPVHQPRLRQGAGARGRARRASSAPSTARPGTS